MTERSRPRQPRRRAVAPWVGVGWLLLSGCWGFPGSHGPEGSDSRAGKQRLESAQAFAAVDEQVKLTIHSPPTGCAAHWSIASPGASLSGQSQSSALFRAAQPGHYVVSYRCGDTELTTAVDSFVPTLSILADPPVKLAVSCNDAAFTDGGQLLCVNQGVSVLDLKTGQVVGRTVENEPLLWGIDAQADLFATASGGCASCGPGGQPLAAGALLYRLRPPGTPELLARLSSTAAEEVAFAADRLYVTTTSQVLAFDISRPTLPQQLGCLSASLEESVPRVVGNTLFTASYNKLRSFSLSSLSPACNVATDSLAELDLSKLLAILPPALVGQGGLLYIGLPTQLQVVDVRVPTALALGYAANLAVEGMGLDGHRLWVAADGKLYLLDLSQPAEPRPIGFLRLPIEHRTYFGRVGGKLHMLNGNQLWTLTSHADDE